MCEPSSVREDQRVKPPGGVGGEGTGRGGRDTEQRRIILGLELSMGKELQGWGNLPAPLLRLEGWGGVFAPIMKRRCCLWEQKK